MTLHVATNRVSDKWRLAVVGAAGSLGRRAVQEIACRPGLELVAAVSRRFHDSAPGSVPLIASSLRMALDRLPEGIDVVVDVSDPQAALDHALLAVDAGCHVIIGATVPDAGQYADLGRAARLRGVSVLVAPNLSASVGLLRLVARVGGGQFTSAAIEDRASAHVPVPLRTTVDLAACLRTMGLSPSVFSVREDGYVSEIELRLAAPGQELCLVARANSALPFVDGILAAVDRLGSWRGLRFGLDSALFEDGSLATDVGCDANT